MRWVLAVILVGLVGACSPDLPSDATATITGRLVAGPVCPVETNPPDPSCAPRPLVGSEVIATLSDGTEIRAVSGEDGGFRIALPPGQATITFAAADSPMVAPDPITVTIAADQTLDVGEVAYDTGIR
jgi:hypothetical protein